MQKDRLGIGTGVFHLYKEIFEDPAASEFGLKMDNSSLLIDDGIPFVAKMRPFAPRLAIKNL